MGTMSEGLREPWERLVQLDLAAQLPGSSTAPLPHPLTDGEISSLLAIASSLALSEETEERKQAYEIATRLIEYTRGGMAGVNTAASVILARLGNFPSRNLVRSRYGHSDYARAPFYVRLEEQAREVGNTVVDVPGKPVTLTDFQYKFLHTLRTSPAASISAPTSAGKSHILALFIASQLQRYSPSSIAYVVPTRALIRQVMQHIIHLLNKAGLSNVPVRCVPLPVARDDAPRGVVYVLTQERLLSLLHADEGNPWLTDLVVDEAQGVRDGTRGILLHSAVDATMTRFPAIRMYFASPLVKNPEYLLTLFHRRSEGVYLRENHSPVSRNLMMVRDVRGAPKQAHFSMLDSDGVIDLGHRNLDFRLRDGISRQKALLAIAVTQEGDSTIVYEDDPAGTERVAETIANELPEPEDLHGDVLDLIQFIRDHIHPEYPLVNTLRRGVASHYGHMPSLVRARIESLAAEAKIRYVCCTSTLLQGVNLPAKHIIIDNPHRGRQKPMRRSDFLNLAGRAGRLLREFHGNVWCLRPDKWEEPCYQGDDSYPVASAFGEVVAEGGGLIRQALDGSVESSDRELAGVALSKALTEHILNGASLARSPHATDEHLKDLRETDTLIRELRVSVPRDVLVRNPSVNPLRLDALYARLFHTNELEEWLPKRPYEVGSYGRMRKILTLLDDVLSPSDREFENPLILWLSSQWMGGIPLGQIIGMRIEYLRKRGSSRSVRRTVVDILRVLEDGVRFRAVRATRAYCDVLAVAARAAQREDLLERLWPVYLFLECGASDRVVLGLISVGLSRTTALLVRPNLRVPQEATPEQCLAALAALDLKPLGLPELCQQEIHDVLRS